MKPTYIYISQEQKDNLFRLAKQKKLSVSTLVNIIVKHYQFRASAYGNKYIKKGTCKIHLKLKDKPNYDLITDILATNCIYEWQEKPTKEIDYKKIDSQIQSEMDKTKDIFYNYNMTIRNNARAIRENKEYYKRILNQ